MKEGLPPLWCRKAIAGHRRLRVDRSQMQPRWTRFDSDRPSAAGRQGQLRRSLIIIDSHFRLAGLSIGAKISIPQCGQRDEEPRRKITSGRRNATDPSARRHLGHAVRSIRTRYVSGPPPMTPSNVTRQATRKWGLKSFSRSPAKMMQRTPLTSGMRHQMISKLSPRHRR